MCDIGHCAATVNLEYYIAAQPDWKRLLLILLMTTSMLMMMTMTVMMTTVLMIMRTKSRLPRRTVTRTVDAKNSIRRILEAKSISTSFLFQPVEDNRTDTRDDDNNKPEKLPHTGEVFSSFRILSNVGMLNADIRIG